MQEHTKALCKPLQMKQRSKITIKVTQPSSKCECNAAIQQQPSSSVLYFFFLNGIQRKGNKTNYFHALIESKEVTALNKKNKKNLRKKESYATENKKIIHAYESLAGFSQRGALFPWDEPEFLIWSAAARYPFHYCSELPAPIFAIPSPSTAAQHRLLHSAHNAQTSYTSIS